MAFSGPTSRDCTARRNLSHLLTHLRRTLPSLELIDIGDDQITLNPDYVWSDTTIFENLCTVSGPHYQIALLKEAVELYRGPFLAGVSLATSPDFETWVTTERGYWERLYLEALSSLIDEETARGHYHTAIDYAQRYLAVNDLAEEIHRRLILLYATSGDRQAAQHQFEHLTISLERELGVAPCRKLAPRIRLCREATNPYLNPGLNQPRHGPSCLAYGGAKMKVFHVNDSPVRELEAEIPLAVQLAAQEQLIQRQQRLFAADKELSVGLAGLREEYKDEIRYLVGAETVEKYAEQYSELLTRITETPKKFPWTPQGEKEKEEYRESLKKEKHELYHSLGFDTKRAIVIRKKFLKRAREILDRGIDLKAEMPADDDAEEPKPTSNPWTWVFPPYSWQWTHINQSNGSGNRWTDLNASAVSGEISLWNQMELFGADDSDSSRVDIMSEVGFWFRMPAAGLVEVWIWYQDIHSCRILGEKGKSGIL